MDDYWEYFIGPSVCFLGSGREFEDGGNMHLFGLGCLEYFTSSTLPCGDFCIDAMGRWWLGRRSTSTSSGVNFLG